MLLRYLCNIKVILLFVFLGLTTGSASAMILKEDIATNDFTRYLIQASPTDNTAVAAQIRLEIIGGEFVKFSPESNLALPGCEEKTFFTTNQLCVDLTNGLIIKQGDILGIIEVHWQDGAAVKKIIYGNDAAYVSLKDKQMLSGILIDLGAVNSGAVISGDSLIWISFAVFLAICITVLIVKRKSKVLVFLCVGILFVVIYHIYSTNVAITKLPDTGATPVPEAATFIPISNIIVLGDSISALFHDDPQQYSQLVRSNIQTRQGSSIQYMCTAGAGTRTGQLITQINNAISQISTKPKKKTLILITSGTNDAGAMLVDVSKTDLIIGQMRTNINNFIAHVKSSSFFSNGVSIYLMNVYDPTDGVGRGTCDGPALFPGSVYSRIFNLYSEIEDANPNLVHIVDGYHLFLGHGYYHNDSSNPYYHPENPSYWFVDCIHPNSAGYKAMGNEFIKRINMFEVIVPTHTPMPTNTPLPTVTPTAILTATPTIEPTITPTVTPTEPIGQYVCGPIDVDGNEILDILDFTYFAKAYQKICVDQIDYPGCGGKDTNNDKTVDIYDLIYLAEHYGNILPNCSID